MHYENITCVYILYKRICLRKMRNDVRMNEIFKLIKINVVIGVFFIVVDNDNFHNRYFDRRFFDCFYFVLGKMRK